MQENRAHVLGSEFRKAAREGFSPAPVEGAVAREFSLATHHRQARVRSEQYRTEVLQLSGASFGVAISEDLSDRAFSQAWGSYRNHQEEERASHRPLLVATMSLPPAIPRRVARQQSPPPLHRLMLFCRCVQTLVTRLTIRLTRHRGFRDGYPLTLTHTTLQANGVRNHFISR